MDGDRVRPVPIPAQVSSSAIPSNGNDEFARLITQEELTLPALFVSLGIAFVWGAMHAMTPGHGKTIVGAYLVGSRGTALHALYLGLTTTITHTAGVFALGAVTMFASRYLFPELLFPWLSFASGLLVVGLGVSLFWNRLNFARRRSDQPVATEKHLDSSEVHDHFHNHDHNRDHDHHHGHGHIHDPGSHHHRDHVHEILSGHHHRESHGHHHSQGRHTHLPPGADGSPVTWRSLLMLGVSGGLLPCPSALVVMLSAVALGRVGFGLLLVAAFSLGLAAVLSGIGMAFVYAGKLFERFPTQTRLLRWFPAASALFITMVGVGIATRALIEMGII